MYRMDPPPLSVEDVFDACVNGLKHAWRRQAYSAVRAEVLFQCAEFDRAARSLQFSQLRPADFEVAGIARDEMDALYTKRLNKAQSVLHLRDRIRSAAIDDTCPYCGFGQVAELDHFLPKSSYPSLAVDPLNLVPSCRDCNRIKGAYLPSTTASSHLHPYFDDVLNSPWLTGEVIEGPISKPRMAFKVNQNITGELRGRLEAHLNAFGLHDRLAVKSAQILNGFERGNVEWKNSGLNEARQKLEDLANYTGSYGENALNPIVYRAMRDSEWYLLEYLKVNG